MNFNWGHGIFLTIVGFMLFMSFMVYQCFQLNVDLVSDDYYAKEIAFQGQIDKEANANELAQPVTWNVENEQLKVVFPAVQQGKELTGTIHFFRPSHDAYDTTFAIQVNPENVQYLPLEAFRVGKYEIQLEWKVDDNAYYHKGIIVF